MRKTLGLDIDRDDLACLDGRPKDAGVAGIYLAARRMVPA